MGGLLTLRQVPKMDAICYCGTKKNCERYLDHIVNNTHEFVEE